MKPYPRALLRAAVAGFITASFLPSLFALVCLLIDLARGDREGAKLILFLYMLTLSAFWVVILSACVLVGVPTALFVQRSAIDKHEVYVVLGVIFGFLTLPALLAALGAEQSDPNLLILYVYCALIGGVTANSWSRSMQSISMQNS